jgi:hypothetical protein
MENAIEQCQNPFCKNALVDGYCETCIALTQERLRLCFDCARIELQIKRALEKNGMGEGGKRWTDEE